MPPRLRIDCYISELCGSYYQLQESVDRALSELGAAADVRYHTFYYDEAVARNILGSPSVWINGKDAFPGGNSPGIT